MSTIKAIRKNVTLSTIRRGIWDENPVFRQVLGICSALAVTNLLANTLVMSAGLFFTAAMSSFTVSLLRKYTPRDVRIMAQVLIIASYVICVDLAIKAYYPEISATLGPYVGLIITNCIIMGRCEAFAYHNPPIPALLDGAAAGVGYSVVLLFIAFWRELLGFGTLLGHQVLGDGFARWTIMVMPPGAFFMLGLTVWLFRSLLPPERRD
ncbi:MAG: NADH:ubiquinone reductase (Na(+)-transporting) subunit D [Deltaproteobacteria bacterium]|nr:MAG: NADH:ubiquinone reductase (Na(+)-transporting) subunit D [Deltaproteobacteria bacterium]